MPMMSAPKKRTMTMPAIVPGSVPPPCPESAGEENSRLGPLGCDGAPMITGPTWPTDRGRVQSGPDIYEVLF